MELGQLVATTDLAAVARACGVPHAVNVETPEKLEREMEAASTQQGCRLINVRTEPGHAKVPPRQSDGFEHKYRFVRYVENLEGIRILHLAQQDRQLMKQTDTS